jgi:hypothetical protein
MSGPDVGYSAPDVRVSIHARRRFKARCNLPHRAAKRACQDAYAQGKGVGVLPSIWGQRLIDAAVRYAESNEDVTFCRVHKGFAFVFAIKPNGVLLAVTVLPGFELPGDPQNPKGAHDR